LPLTDTAHPRADRAAGPSTAIPFQLFISAPRSGAENMAIDATLLAEARRTGGAFLRLYAFSPPCLSIGRHEPGARRYDRAAIARARIDVVRRPTGGRAVWHEHEVTYAVAAPMTALGGGTLAESCRTIHARLAAALVTLGVPATLALAAPVPGVAAGACFAGPVGGEVVVAGRKLIGSAQLRDGNAFLQHGSILLDGSQGLVRALARDQGRMGGGAGASGETTLAAVLGRPVAFAEVAEAVVWAWGGDRLAATALDRPDAALTAHFADPAWTWRR
jgi:lipoate-protein ligase A